MFFWFAGLSFFAVLVVFSSPALDFRLVMAGAVLPEVETLIGGPWLLHTLSAACVLLAFVMLATQKQRLRRRQWLGLPIGLFMHLVLDGTWANAEVFWWPFLGFSNILGSAQGIDFSRSVPVLVAMEIVGLATLVFLVRRLDLAGEGRQTFLSTGQVLRSKLEN